MKAATPRCTPVTMTLDAAWATFKPELLSVTEDVFSDEDYADYPEKATLVEDIKADRMSPDVLSEIEDCLQRDWCRGAEKLAALVILAETGRLDVYDPKTQRIGRKPKTRIINGVRYETWE